ncbi:hypothetical protein OPV22_000936 [Ensete ventricosum]|uniref:Pentatricopeptide repeat-containing protein n=1 Tax=Ensete ventricosum TaxID=4639 RepID=A0AAV8RVV0_ENSVE|nr:hypothetical protein OPV22_000936 [Ensete ventricosum]
MASDAAPSQSPMEEEQRRVLEKLERDVQRKKEPSTSSAQNRNYQLFLVDAHGFFDAMTVRLPSSWNALIAGHTRVGAFAAAENLFAEMPDKTIISWTATISGYCQNGLADRVTVVSVLPAWAPSAALEQGERIHRYPSAMGFDRHPTVQIALVGMYAKCGNLAKARHPFDRIPEK